MPAKIEIVIQDTCMLLDLCDLELLKIFFSLEMEVYTTIQVVNEITDDEQWQKVSEYIQNQKLKVVNTVTIEIITEITTQYPGLSFTDGSVMGLAQQMKAMVLSSDGSLKKACLNSNLEIHGMLWIIEQMFNAGIITGTEACNYLMSYEKMNPRAPKNEIKILMEKFKQEK